MPQAAFNLEGRQFDRLTAVKYMGKFTRGSWFCRCSCGGSIVARGHALVRGTTRSCGCLGIQLRANGNTTHGDARRRSKAPEYKIYITIIRRCTDTKTHRSKDYVLRGISICDRWRRGQNGLSGYQCFIADMGPRPSKLHSIDRIDNDGNYEPSNCRWATKAEQARNRRNNRKMRYRGRLITLTDAEVISGFSSEAILGRLHRGWSPEDAIEKPLTPQGRVVASARQRNSRFNENSIRAFVENRWSPGIDPEAIYPLVKAKFDANRHYVRRICLVLSERHTLLAARSTIFKTVLSLAVRK